ncbi:hypothetical protein ACFQH9_31950, partial [Pseudonocardia lutea]
LQLSKSSIYSTKPRKTIRTRECMKNVWYNKNIINKIECCSVDNLQSLLSIIAAKMKSMIYQK